MNRTSTSHPAPNDHCTNRSPKCRWTYVKKTSPWESLCLKGIPSGRLKVCQLLFAIFLLTGYGLQLVAQQTQPVLDWSTYFNGTSPTRNDGVKYVVGDDGSIWFGSLVGNDGGGTPTTPDAWQTSFFGPAADANSYSSYIGKLSPDGQFQYGSYFGANRGDYNVRMGQDENYVYALNFIYHRWTNRNINWPTTGNNYDLANRGGADNDQGFYQLVKIDKSTNTPVLVTELPGTEYLFENTNGVGRSIPHSNVFDIRTQDGYAYFAGRGHRRPREGTNESWAYIIRPDHTGLYIDLRKVNNPMNSNPANHAVRVGDYIAAENGDFIIYGGARGDGSTGDNAFLTTDNTVYTDPVGNWDMFLRRYDRDGNLIFSTLLGGTGTELLYDSGSPWVTKVLEMPDGTILVSGETTSTDFPYTDGTVDANTTTDVFLAAYTPDGTHLWTKGFVSDAIDNNLFNMAVHPDGQQLIIHTMGNGDSGNNLTITPNAAQPNYGGGEYDQYIAFLDPGTGNTNYGTWYGATGDDRPRYGAGDVDILVYDDDILFSGISINSTDYPVSPGATDRDYGAFLVLNSDGSLEMATTTNMVIEKPYMDDEVIYAYGYYDPSTPEYSTLNAFQPTSNSAGDNRQAVVVKIRRCDGKVAYQTFLGGEHQQVTGQGGSYVFINRSNDGTYQPDFIDGKFYAATDFSSLVQPHPTTEGAFQTSAGGGSGLAFFSFDMEKEVTWEDNLLVPDMQLTCTNGIAEVIDGSRVVINPDDLPDIIRGGQESYPEQKAVYQWQIASSATGPWADINGAVQEDYQHNDIGDQDIYLRRLAFNPNECDCNDTLSISNIHQIQVSNDEAPTAEAGIPARICPGETWPLGGSPSATGGTAPYTYKWEPADALTSISDSSIANPIALPVTSTIYTLEVLDANGCRALDQVTVTPWTYTAGEDKSICFGESGLRIGTPRPAGASEATYSWSVVSGDAGSLSCTDCPQPIASPSTNTVYAAEVTFPSDNGTTCMFTDQVAVNIASYPGADFAGPDMATCLNNPISINGNYDVITLGNSSLPATAGYSYQWSPLNSFIDGSQQNQRTIEFSNGIFIPSTIPQTYTLTMTTPEGCVYQDQVQVYPLESDLGDDRCAPKVVGNYYDPDIYDGNALYTYNVVGGNGSLDIDNDCESDGATVSGMDLTWVRVLDNPNAEAGDFTDVEQVVNYDGFICRDTVRIFYCIEGNCIFDIEAEGGNCPIVGPDGTLTLVPVNEAGGPWPNNGDWTFEWTNAAGSVLTTNYELNVTDPAQAWYYLRITSTVPVGGDNPCYPDREPHYTTCVDSILVNAPGFARPMIDFGDTTICFGDEVEIGSPGGGFDYEWTDATGTFESTAPNPTVSPTVDATYYVTVTDPGTECFTTDTVRVTVLTVPIDAGPDRYICNNAVIQLGADTAQAGLIYQWQPEAAPWRMPPPNTTTSDPDGAIKAQPWVLVAADLEFYLTVTDTMTGCMVIDTVNIYTANAPVVEMATAETICAGESVALGPMEENPDYLYEWTPADGLSCTDCFSPQASPEMSTDYQLRVRFADPSCPNDTTLNVSVTVNESDITMGPDMNFCPGDASLQIQGAPSMTDQGNAITSYMWAPTTNMNDPTLQTPTVSPPPNSETTYTVTTTDANGCMASGSVTYTPETIANAGPGRTLCIGETVPIGSPDNIGSIAWTGVGGAPVGALSNPTIAQPIFDSEVSGVGTFQYQVSVSNNGCTTTDMVTVTVQGFDPPLMDPITLCRNSCGIIGFENNDPDLEFFWSPEIGLSNPNSSMTMVCVDTVDRFYELTIRNTVSGCVSQATVSVTVQESEAPQVDIPDAAACFGQQVVLEPNIVPDTGDLTYDWSPTLGLSDPFVRNPTLNTEALGIGIHTYELTVVDEHGCINIASMQVIITENGCCTVPVINTIVKDASCGAMDGAVTIVLPDNPEAYNILWSPTPGTISPDGTQMEHIETGVYQVTVVDTAFANIPACEAEELLIVGTHQEELVVNEVVNEPANCSEGTGGMVQLSPSYYTYTWSDGGTGYIRNDLEAGCYVVEVTVPGSECTDIMEVCVEEAGALQFTGVIEEPQCETSDGSITIMPTSDTGPYNAQWSDGQIGLERENLTAGIYSVTVTDATGCSGDTTFILSNDVAATGDLIISSIDPECAGEATGSISFGGSCTGCVEPVSIRLLDHSGASIGENSPVANLKPGNYTVLMEDANGCLIEGEEIILNDPPTMHLDIDKLEMANCNGEFGSIDINVRGGSPEYSYLWGPDGQTTQNLMGVDTGSYTIVVTDANGCVLASEQQLAADSICCPQIGIQSSVVVDAECGPTVGSGTAAVVPTGSPSGYTFAWYDSDSVLVTTDSLVTGLEPGAYRVVVHADVPACTDSVVYVLTVGTLQGPQITVNSVTDATCLDSDGSASVSVVEGTGPFTYLWNTGETTAELTNVPAGTYWVVVTDSTGCSETEVVIIGQTAGDMALSMSGTDAICNLTNGSASVSVTGGTGPYTYQWSNGFTTQNISNLPAGVYSVTVIDANGCMQTGEVAISNTGGPALTVEVATDVLCIGDASGVVNLSSSDPNATLELRDDQGMIVGVGNTVENLWAGTYTVVARSADGCETYETVTIIEPAEVLDLEISHIIPATCEDELGRLDIDVMGGTGPYTYEWSNGATTEDLENIPSGSYYVVVTDANGCTVEEGYELGQDVNCNTQLAFRKEHIDLTYAGNPNEFLLEYYLIAENPDTLPGYYSLYDSIAFAEGVTVVDVAPVSYIGGDGLSGVINPGFDGVGNQLVMSNDTLTPGISDTFLITMTLHMDFNVITTESGDCDPLNNTGNTGLTNVGTLVSPDSTIRDTVCTPIPVPGVAMTKSIVSEPIPTGNVNEFTMTYVITVEDTTGYRAYYDLSDTIQYGACASFVSGVVTYGGTDGLNTGIITLNPTDTAYQIVDDEWIDSLRVDSFYVEVIFTIDPSTLTAESADCDYTNDGGANSGLTNVAVINDGVPLDRDTICRPIPIPGVEMTKSIVSDPVPTGNVNEFTMTYVITVEDTTGYRAYYDLSDTIQYGAGATFVSGIVTYGGTDGLNTGIITLSPTDTAYQIVDDEWIDSLRTDSFYVEVLFTIDPATLTAESADCDYTNNEGNSGLTNVAVINDGVPLDRDTVCAPIPIPGVAMTKSIVSEPVPTGNVNEFTMTYVITVEDTTGYRAYYDLSDTIQYGAGASFVSGVVTYGGTDGLNTGIITLSPTDTAYQIVDDEWIDSLQTDSFYVEVLFTIDPATLTAESADCDYTNDGGANSGLTNVAVINDGVPLDRDTVCAPIPLPGVAMTKSIVSEPVPTGNVNEFTMTYVITVEDTTGYRAYYDLSDTIQYGAGASFVSGVVTYGGTDGLNTGIITLSPTDTAYQIVDDEWIDSLQTDSFYVEVIFTIDPATLTAESADCDYTNDGGANSGLTNVAVINDGVPLDRDTVCAPIPLPGVAMTKSIVSEPVPTGNVNEFTMTYVITVEDTTGYRAYYDLSDTIQYGAGATFVSGIVTYGGTDGQNTGIVTPAPTDTAYQIVDDEWIDSLRVDSFYVEVIFTIDPLTLTAESADCDYTNDGGANSGLTNVAVINDAVPLDRDTVCAPIPLPGVLLTKEVIRGQTPTGNVNEFSILYAIAVEDTTGYRAYYDLVDTLKYGAGADFVSATVSYGGSDDLQTGIVEVTSIDTTIQIVQNEYVEHLASDSFYVEAVFTLDPNVLTQESADCDYTNNEGQSGLTNVVTLNGAIPEQKDTACAQIFLPGAELIKTVESGPTPTGNPLEYSITYAISVRDTMGIPVFYDLSDTLKYGESAVVQSIVVSYAGSDGLQTSILDTIPAGPAYQIVMNEPVDDFDTDIYRIQVIFRVDAETFTAANADCVPGASPDEYSGLTNVAVIDNAIPIQRDTACTEIPPPCTPVNCHGTVNLSFGTDCEIEVTADMLLIQNGLARAFPDQYKVELSYGNGIAIPGNILRPEHVGREIRAKVTLLLDECGRGMCESTIILEKPNACLIQNTLDTAVYCTDPFLQLDPLDPAYPRPEMVNVCNSATLTLEVSPDWVMATPCDEDSDTAEIIFREWTATTAGGARCTGVDTIVVYRLPKLTPESFIAQAEDSFYCELEQVVDTGERLVRYSSWKQPIGLHDYEQPYDKLHGVVYEIPSSIILAGMTLADSLGGEVMTDYLNYVILRKADGEEVTIGEIVTGAYMDKLIAKATEEQKTYGFLQALIQLNENPVKFILETVFEFYPYLLLQPGDWILSEEGHYEQVDVDWFYTGNGRSPYWFSGGWPFISGNGTCISYHDGGRTHEFDCILVAVPSIDADTGLNPQLCDTICLSVTGPHCGITIEQEKVDWSQTHPGKPGTAVSCPQLRGLETWITQTCWAETSNSCGIGEGSVDNDIVTDYQETAKSVQVHLSQWQSLIDTIGPIFDFCYSSDWDQTDLQESIRQGVISEEAQKWEQENPTVYRVNEYQCEAEILVPDVRVIDNCSGIHSVKAEISVNGSSRVVGLEWDHTEQMIMPNGDTSYIQTYVHKTDPIRIPFRDCNGGLIVVNYEASDNCWNQSTWNKYIRITDDTPPTVVTNNSVNISLEDKTVWARAATFDEGSWDNCSVGQLLVRRPDWAADTTLVNICDGLEVRYDNWVDLLADLGVDRNQLATAIAGEAVGIETFNNRYEVEQLQKVLNDGEIESHYFDQITWLWYDEEVCGKKLVHGWLYAIATEIANHCSEADEHGNPLELNELKRIFDYLMDVPGYGQELAYLGGGWSKDVPFTCADACSEPEVDLLVLDQCCNIGIGRTTVQVKETVSQVRKVRQLSDLTISCEAYNLFYQDIVENAAALGEEGSVMDSTGIFAALDEALGGYVLTWVDNQNRPVDLQGRLLTPEELNFGYRNVSCSEESITEKVAVPTHDGRVDWVNQVTKRTSLDTTSHTGTHGIVGINCSGSSVQDVWLDLDECGNGTITRRFLITSGCGTDATPIEIKQVIRIESACALRESMFDLPSSMGSSEAPVCLQQSLSDAYYPDTLGSVKLKSHLAGALCNSLTFGKEIKELTVQGSTDMRKYQITWSVKDWCGTHTGGSDEFTFTQEVVAIIDPACNIEQNGTSGNGIRNIIDPGDRVLRNSFELYQNYPNPFEGYTVIGFELPEAMDARLTIYDVTGKVLYELIGSYAKGYNEVEVSPDELSVTGVLFYQLETDKYMATKRMVRGVRK